MIERYSIIAKYGTHTYIEREETLSWMAETMTKSTQLVDSVGFAVSNQNLFANKRVYIDKEANSIWYAMLTPKKYFILAISQEDTEVGVPAIEIIDGCESKAEVSYTLGCYHPAVNIDYDPIRVLKDPTCKLLKAELSETCYSVFGIATAEKDGVVAKYYIINKVL